MLRELQSKPIEYPALQSGQRRYSQFHATPVDVFAAISHAPWSSCLSNRWKCTTIILNLEFQEFIRANEIRLVGIGAMTRLVRCSYKMADAARAAGALVVMGGPHVTEVPDEPLGRDGGPRHVDAVALAKPMQPGHVLLKMQRKVNCAKFTLQ